MAVEEKQEGEAVTVFHAYGCSLSKLSSYKYLGIMIMESDNDLVAVILNLGEVQKQ